MGPIDFRDPSREVPSTPSADAPRPASDASGVSADWSARFGVTSGPEPNRSSGAKLILKDGYRGGTLVPQWTRNLPGQNCLRAPFSCT
jgi:hypothetical protein